MRMGPIFVLAALGAALCCTGASAQDREITFRFQPTGRAQLALWIESEDGSIFQTVRLTQAVARRGIGNRPGATQMNSGFRWPYGRRESALPVWAHRRTEVGGQPAFQRVIFNGRESEGLASISFGEGANTRDDYFCLSFDRELSSRDALDAVSCASVFNSNKGRYLSSVDVAEGYAEPWEDGPASGFMRPMPRESLYPPRRDLPACAGECPDHPDVQRFGEDSRQAMPEIDAVTTATYDANLLQELPFTIPPEWPDGNYVAYLEIHVEGDHNDTYGPARYPTPTTPTSKWDTWAINYGYAYRGQPSMAYRVAFTLSGSGGVYEVDLPEGYGSISGEDGDIRPLDATIADDPSAAPGSGVDRLGRMAGGSRFVVAVRASNVCEAPDPPPECSLECGPAVPCPSDFLCSEAGTCVGLCDVTLQAPMVMELTLRPHEDIKHAHEWAHMSFVAPDWVRRLARYEVRVSTTPIVDEESFMRAAPANAADLDSVELVVPVNEENVDIDFGGLLPELEYWVGVRPVDECNDVGPIAVARVTTKPIHFTTVSPCFVATAAHGSPMADDVGILRRFRDRHLMTSAPGRALVDLYYEVSPSLAEAIAEDDVVRAATRFLLSPVVGLAALAP